METETLTKRILVIVIFIPILVVATIFGGWILIATFLLILGIAAWEFGRMFTHGQHQPSQIILVGGAVALTLTRYFYGIGGSALAFCLLIMLAMIVHTLAYNRGRETAATDFAITLAGLVYIGWLGPYIISLRNLPDGQYWSLLVLMAIWMADMGAFLIGRRFGRHKMMTRVSPKKSWEGYFGGILFGVVGTALLALLWSLNEPAITFQKGALLGLLISVLAPIGDFGESMIKRQFNLKDSGSALPGHGGILDRIDSWLWAWVIGYYLIINFWS